jgi:Paraquat-inducible protein A
MKILNHLRLLISIALLCAIAQTAYRICTESAYLQYQKYDEANLNHMKYGIFNVNAWKDKMASIIVAEIEEFQINNKNKQDMTKHVEGQLTTMIEKFNNQIKEENKNSTKGWIKQKLINAFVDVEKIKQSVPEYADTIVQEMTDKDSQKKLKQVIKERVSKYLDKTFEPYDVSEVNSIIERTGQKNKEEAAAFLAKTVQPKIEELFRLTWILLGLSALLFLSSSLFKQIPTSHFLVCVVTLLLLLYAGVTCPMIDMIARIANFHFMLFGHKVEFLNQIVYYQSKSILDVFWILMEDPAIEMKCVGVLMILFSIVFPVIKIVCSLFYYFNVASSQQNAVVRFFVLKSGKWSMTDVMIVAILMAYIGFNGMVTTQFNVIRAAIPQFELISHNDTTLQIGFYIFLVHVLLAMMLAALIEQKPKSTP